MAIALGVLALLAQLAAFVSIAYLISDLAGLPRVFFPAGDWTIALLLPHVLETTVSYWGAFLLGAAGATVAALLIFSSRLDARWFVVSCRVVGWLWIPLVPIGTVLGILLLRARRRAPGRA